MWSPPPGESVWVERGPSNVLAPAFVQQFAGAIRLESELFDALLVHLGGLGILNAVLLEVTEGYMIDLVRQKKRLGLAELRLHRVPETVVINLDGARNFDLCEEAARKSPSNSISSSLSAALRQQGENTPKQFKDGYGDPADSQSNTGNGWPPATASCRRRGERSGTPICAGVG